MRCHRAVDPAPLVVSASCVVASTPVALAGVRAYRTFSGIRFVICPESASEAAVRIQAARAMATAIVGRPDVRLKSCSGWPERQGCDQACVRQIGESSNGCRSRASSSNSPARPRPLRKPAAAVSSIRSPDEFIGAVERN